MEFYILSHYSSLEKKMGICKEKNISLIKGQHFRPFNKSDYKRRKFWFGFKHKFSKCN
jgi:hypothetical protein